MSKLVKNSTPAERFIGCSFADRFETVEDVIANEGSISGSPIIDFGAVLDGTSDYISYEISDEFNSDNISLVIDFEPDFEADDSIAHAIFDGDSGLRYGVIKSNTNTLDIRLGGQTIASLSLIAYQAFWNVNSRNNIVISGTSGSTNAWLNGNQVVTNSTTVFTAKKNFTCFVGSDFLGSSKYSGKITSVKIFQTLFEAQDAINYYKNSNFSYHKNSVLHIDMSARLYDPSNHTQLDLSPLKNNVIIGNGAGSNSPEKKNGHYEYSTAEALDAGTDVSLNLKNNFTWFCVAERRQGLESVLISTGGGALFRILSTGEVRYTKQGITGFNSNSLIQSGQVYFICLTQSSTEGAKIYINGNLDVANVTIADLNDITAFWIGNSALAGTLPVKKMYETIVYNTVLTDLQVADLYLSSKRTFNNV